MKDYKTLLNKAIGKKEMLTKLLDKKQSELSILKDKTVYIENAQAFIQDIAQKTQNRLKIHIEDIVQLALDSCWPDKYNFNIEFTPKRGRTEAEICFLQDGNKIDPMFASGGGVIDVASFALRIAAWSLSTADNIMIMDEPGKFISKDLIPRFAAIIKELSNKLDLQFLIVTHIPELTETADKVFRVKIKDGISEVKNETMPE